MEFKILEEKKKKLIFELKGVQHGFCNAIKKELWNDETVILSSYTIDHPLVGIPKFTIEVKEGDPKDALKKAIDRLKKTTEQFKVELKKIK